MPTIVTASQLRTILGVSSSLYSDAYLDDIIDASENSILPMLVAHKVKIDGVSLYDNVAYFSCSTLNTFTQEQSVVITGCGNPFDGTRTIGSKYDDSFFTAAITNDDVLAKNLIPAGTATLSGAATYVGNSNVEAAVLAISVEIFQARTAAGGSIEGVDFAVTPYRLSKNLLAKVTGLLGPYLDTDAMVG
jgi:hypothetical protein